MTSPECTQNIPEPFNVPLHLFKGLLQLNCGKPFFKSGTDQLDLSPQWRFQNASRPCESPLHLAETESFPRPIRVILDSPAFLNI